ncbi:MAG: alpha/beta hydrolase-fold protein [Acidobacteriota bacterium]
MMRRHTFRLAAAALVTLSTAAMAFAQEGRTGAPPAPAGRGGGRGAQAPAVISPEVLPDRHITFRIYAPQAQAIRLAAGDIPGVGQTTQLTKAESGIWDVTIGPIDPGAYRYNFNIDGVSTIDPRNPATSESNTNVWSLVIVPGSSFTDTKDVPHGAVAAITYHSSALGAFRRMHVYTPPGYESGSAKYPVFYLLHGAGDSDDAWTSVGRAGFILDNLIAAGKAKPMVVVMPAGHTSRGPATGGVVGRNATQEFVQDFTTDVMPYVAKHYRVLTDRAHTAIAGLSMGGSQTLHIAIPHLDKFAYIGVFSSGLIGGFPGLAPAGRGAPAPAAPAATAPSATAPPAAAATLAAPAAGGPPPAADWEKQNAAMLDNPSLRKGLRVLWFATGKDDGLITTSRATVDLLKKHGLDATFSESAGGHTWINWRDYLNEFAPRLF